MIPAVLFLLLLSMTNVLLGIPVDYDDKSEKPLKLLDDIVIPDIWERNADPCTAIGCKWPKTGRFVNVPYEISSDYSKEQRKFIIDSLEQLHGVSCIRFVPRSDQHRDYIHFFSEEGRDEPELHPASNSCSILKVTFIMIPAVLFLLLLSMTNVLLGIPVDYDDKSEETPELLDDIVIPDIRARNAVPCTAIGCKWPKTGRFVNVPYEISSDYSKEQRKFIIDSLKKFHDVSCIRFVPRSDQHRDYIHIFSGKKCSSPIGRQKGGQKISLRKSKCLKGATVQHEVLHALGFKHEQVRSDRDDYVEIHFENIEEGMAHNFFKTDTNNLGTPYDFNSIMEYDNTAFSKNGKPTIVAKRDPKMKFGHAKEFSVNDIARVNKLYKCSNQKFIF
ncbi:low choriolytic enzyme-like [Gambusia affinis]|uniref:low choriolytic enzyme-like n=1 Tax=Gambusia affinis TaxID=33528 RepID=UPI001CDC75D4|nr:low choriolytic enzyme-like [Gambusia affinis]